MISYERRNASECCYVDPDYEKGTVRSVCDCAIEDFEWYVALYVTGSGKRAHLAQVINFQFIALSERTHFVLSNAL